MATAVRAELERVGKLETVPGAIAMRLARTLDDPKLGPAQVASLSDKLLKILGPMSKAGPQEPDEVDEFVEQIAAKLASA